MNQLVIPPLAGQMLRGTEAIGKELGVSRQQVAALIKTTNIPAFKIGGITFARRSTLAAWVFACEMNALEARHEQRQQTL